VVEFDAQAGGGGDLDFSILVFHEAALDDVALEMVIVGVGGEGEIGEGGGEVEHGGELDAELAGGVDGDAELEGFADGGGFDAGFDAAPEGGVE